MKVFHHSIRLGMICCCPDVFAPGQLCHALEQLCFKLAALVVILARVPNRAYPVREYVSGDGFCRDVLDWYSFGLSCDPRLLGVDYRSSDIPLMLVVDRQCPRSSDMLESLR